MKPLVEAASVAPEFGRGAVEPHPPLRDQDDAIGQRLDLLQDVGREQDRLALAEPPNRLADLANLVGVEAAGRLVEDQHVGFVEQHLRHAHPLPVALGQLANRLTDHASQFALLDDRLDPRLLAVSRQATGVGEELEQAAGRHVGIERPILRQVAEPLGTGEPVGRHVVAGNPGRAGRGGEVARQDLHRGALPGAVGAQEGDDLAAGNAE